MKLIALACAVAATGAALAGSGARSEAQVQTGSILFLRAHSEFGRDLASLYRVDPDGTNVRLIAAATRAPVVDKDGDCHEDRPDGVTDEPDCYPIVFARWSPDRRRVAFVRSLKGLYVVNADGRSVRRLAGGDVREFDWAPDGRRIAYTLAAGIFVTSSTRPTPRRIVRFGLDQSRLVEWSPNGRLIAYRRENGVWVVTPSGGLPRRVARTVFVDSVSWSSDSRLLAYSTLTPGLPYVVRSDGRNARPVVGGARYAEELVWAPRGTALAYRGSTACPDSPEGDEPCDRTQVVVHASADVAYERVDANVYANHLVGIPGTRAVWSPDAKRIAFPHLNGGIFVKTLGEPGQRQIVGGEVGPVDW